MTRTLRLGTRASALALAQSRQIADRLRASGDVAVELIEIHSEGDLISTPLAQLGGTGVFAATLRMSLLAGRCDLVVHSMKDLPVAGYPGLEIGAVPERADVRDALCARRGFTLETLPKGAKVGTGSPRRVAALAAARPDLEIVGIRGNVDTRLSRVTQGDLHAVVLAAAGLGRLGRLDDVTEFLEFAVMPPAPAQGALAIEVRSDDLVDDAEFAALIAGLDHLPSRASSLAERAVLGVLEAGCSAPIGASATIAGRTVSLRAAVLAPDGSDRRDASTRETADDLIVAAEIAGRRLAEQLLADGAGDLVSLGGTV